MGPLTIIYLLNNFPNLNSWIIDFFGGPFSFELDKFDCIMFRTSYLCFEGWKNGTEKLATVSLLPSFQYPSICEK